ncbi:tetratricopeptide repeat protein [Chloroflexus sp. Y-396-1]|uniref:tetratricopeptide repeat protein n=1 Tax=Chloroflexus sp. Y-396-1 TaxID=867845 RepID=UPI00048C51FE|nr:tetratricopeptide repeat protein [Chloroflexus sp. Y-396-1]
MSEHELERYTGAWATPDLVGRHAILKQIDTAISSASGASIIALYGKGGIGKTRILNDTFKRRKPGLFLAQQVVDLYDMQYHSSLALASAIYASLNVANSGHFRTFEEKRAQQYKAQISGDVRAIAEATQETLQAFITDFNRFSQSQHVVIALDTVERIAYGATEQRPPFQVAAAWQWLIETLPNWGNVTVLVAGRNQIRHLFPDPENHPAIRLTTIEVGPFTLEETNEYLDAVARAAEQAGEQAVANALRSLNPQYRERVYRYSGGAPIMLALLADYISISGFGQIPDILDVDTDPARAQEELERQIVKRMIDTKGIRDMLPMLGRVPKGVDEELLAYLLEISVEETRDRLEPVKRLSFVKVRDGRYFLHDEMYAILARQIYSAPGDAPEAARVNETIIKWYKKQIDEYRERLNNLYKPIEEEHRIGHVTLHLDYGHIIGVQQAINRLLVEHMYYILRLNPLDGFREYFRLSFYTTFTGNTMLDIQLQAELLVFLNERDPLGQQSFIDGLEREVALGVAALRPIVRLYTENNYVGVIQRAQLLRKEEPHTLQTAGRTTEAALNIWEALARLGRASKEEQDLTHADHLLDSAKQILEAIDTSPDVSEAQRWLTRSLLALAHHASGFGLRVRGQIRSAIKEYRLAAARWRQVDVPICLAWTLNNLGFAESEEGNFADGQRLVEEGLVIRKKLGARALIGVSYATLSLVLVYAGNYILARVNAERALRLFQAVEYRLGQSLALRNLAETLRRSVKRDDDPVHRIQILHEAYQSAQVAYKLFEEIGDRPRQIESLIEAGKALRDCIGIKHDYPSLLEDDLDTLMQQSMNILEHAAELARQTNNFFHAIDAYINIASAGFDGKRIDISEKYLTTTREAIPDNYLITRQRIPNPDDQNQVQNRQFFTLLARIHFLIGNRLLMNYRNLSKQPTDNERLEDLTHEYASIAARFIDETPANIQTVDDCLRYAIHHYALSFEYDRLYNPNHPYGLRARNIFYERLKGLNAEELDIVAQAVRTFEHDYPVGKSAMRDLLERCALLIE